MNEDVFNEAIQGGDSMFFKATAAQIRFMLKQKSTVIVFGVLTAMMLINYMTNVITFQGWDVIEMYQPMKLLLLSWNRIIIGGDLLLIFVQLYPLLVVCPAGFSLAKERQTGEDVLFAARMGNLQYRVSKCLAAFVVTAIVFSLPFLIEILLNCMAFPLQAQGDLSNWNYYDPAYRQGVEHYFFTNMEKPDVIMLDEPTNSLDKGGREEIRHLILEEKERGAMILLSSHNEEDIQILADHIYIIEKGVLIKQEGGKI